MKLHRIASLGAVLAAGASANALLIDFESFEWAQSAGSVGHPGTWVTISDSVPLGFTLARLAADNESPGGRFDFVKNSEVIAGMPASWGTTSLDPFFDRTQGYFQMTFSAPITSFSVEAGDFGFDQDEVWLHAYEDDFDSTVLGSAHYTYAAADSLAANNILTANLNAQGQGFRTVVWGAADYDPDGQLLGLNSVYYDNIVVTPVPEPATLGALLLGLAALARRRR